MLSYAFKALKEQGYKSMGTEEFEKAGDLFAAILSKGISVQLKRGLNKEYNSKTESTSVPRGKINITASIKEMSEINNQLICSYDEFSENSYLNQIIKTTATVLLKQDIDQAYKKELKKELLFFEHVDILDSSSINWNIRYDRNNKTYELLIAICYLILKGLINSDDKKNIKLMDYLDDQRMSSLYEKFLLEYYKQEYRGRLKSEATKIDWNIDGDDFGFLPGMKTDITLSDGNKTLIIDAKFYGKTMQEQFNKKTYHSGNMYQIYSYVKNMDKNHTGNVSGMLLYAKTDEELYPDESFVFDKNKISIKTLDLNRPFKEIKGYLDNIVQEHFGMV